MTSYKFFEAALTILPGMVPSVHPLVFAAFLTACTNTGASRNVPPAPETNSLVNLEFALIFRSSAQLDPDVLRPRNEAARDWALDLRHKGTLRVAAPLEDVGIVVAAAGERPLVHDQPVLSVLVISAASLDAAVALAKTHPGLTFGTEIEVRPVKAVAAAVPAGE